MDPLILGDVAILGGLLAVLILAVAALRPLA